MRIGSVGFNWWVTIIIAVVFTTLFAMVGLFVYYKIYERRINKQIKECAADDGSEVTPEKAKKKKLPEFRIVAIASGISLSVVVVIMCVITAITDWSFQVHDDNITIVDTFDYSTHPYNAPYKYDNSWYFRSFSQDENEGYTRRIVIDGDFTFTVFIRNDDTKDSLPDILCYMTYTGDDAYALESRIAYSDEESGCLYSVGWGQEGDCVEHTMLFVGNSKENYEFSVTMYAYDEDAYTTYYGLWEQLQRYAKSTGSVSIQR